MDGVGLYIHITACMPLALALAKRNFWSPLKVSDVKEYKEGA